MALLGRILVQSDWERSCSNADTFWISCKRPGADTIHSVVDCEKTVEGQLKHVVEDPSFKVQRHSQNRLHVSYTDGYVKPFSCSFLAPDDSFTIQKAGSKVTCLDVTSGGLGLSCCENTPVIYVWESKNGLVRRQLTGHVGDIYVARFFPSGVVVLSAGADTQLKIWSAETGDCAATLTGHRAGVHDVEFVERGKNIVSCSRDGTAKLWDVSTQKCLYTYIPDDEMEVLNSCSLRSSPVASETSSSEYSDKEVGTESKLLLLASEKGDVSGFNLQSKVKIFVANCCDAVNCAQFLSEVSFAAGTQDGTVYIFDIRNISSPLKCWKESRSCILDIAPHKQGFFLATGDGSCVLVDETHGIQLELTGPNCDPVYRAVVSGTQLFTSCRDGAVRLYKLT